MSGPHPTSKVLNLVCGLVHRQTLPLLTGIPVSCLTHLGRNVEEVCRFPELPARKPLTYQAKQLIAREIEMEKMRRAEALAWTGGGPQVSLALVLRQQTMSVVWPGPAGSHASVQVDQGPSGPANLRTDSGEKGTRQPAPRNHEQRLEHIMKRAAVQEQVCCGGRGQVGLEQSDEQRVGLAPSPKEPPVAPRKWAVVSRRTPSHRPCSEASEPLVWERPGYACLSTGNLMTLFSASLRGTSLDVWSSGKWQSQAEVCMGHKREGGGGGTGWGLLRRHLLVPAEVEAPQKDTDEWRMGVAVGRSEVWFRFNEGVSNAVRRSLYIRDLL